MSRTERGRTRISGRFESGTFVCPTLITMEQASLAAKLEALGIAAQDLRAVPVEGEPEIIWAFDVDPARWFDTWTSLRGVVDELGCWPLATTTFGAPLEMSIGMDREGPDGLDPTPSAIIARVPDVDIDGLLVAERERLREQWIPDDDHLAYLLENAALDGVDLTRLRHELGASPDELDVERWLLDIELERGVTPNVNRNDGYLDWWTPGEVVMLLVPTVVAWQVGAFVGGYGWGDPHTDLRPALLRRWHQRHGVEVTANWTTMLQLIVPRPPATIEEGWAAAHEINLTWPDTAGGANGVSTRWHAYDLVGRTEWFLHSRP